MFPFGSNVPNAKDNLKFGTEGNENYEVAPSAKIVDEAKFDATASKITMILKANHME